LTKNVANHTGVESFVVGIHTLDKVGVWVSPPSTLNLFSLAAVYSDVIPVNEGDHTLGHVNLALEVCWLARIFGLVHHCVLDLRGTTGVHFQHFLEELIG